MVLVHCTCVDLTGVGVLLRGPPGSGKSDLALRLIDGGARLIADDHVQLEAEGAALIATPPKAIAGMMEVRGLGLVTVPSLPRGRVGLVADLVPRETVERLPQALSCAYEGIEVAQIALAPFEASACAKVRLAAQATRRDIVRSQ